MASIMSFLVLFFTSMTNIDLPLTPMANATTPGLLESYSTRHSIGFEWHITGDANHNATCTVQFRLLDSSVLKASLPLYRVDFEGYNTLAGSLVFLQPNTAYHVELSLSDPDGGADNVVDTIITRGIPVMPTGGNIYHVVPGAGGGNGSQAQPFLGVDAADAVAVPGDIFLLHAGNYAGTVYFDSDGAINNHIVWKAAGDGDPVFEGIRVTGDYIWFDGLKVIDQQYGLRTSNAPLNCVVTYCHFDNNHYSIFLNDGGEGWYIADNTIVGDNVPNTSNFSGEGIELQHTSGHTVAYNTISRVADGISYPHKNVDMFGNDIFDTSDDGIEFDYGHANNRAWKNRITNLFNNGISFQPMDGAPYYVLYNQVSVKNSQSVLKLRDRSDRALIAHNTFICNSGPMSSGSHYLVNFEIKNNLWISINDRYAWENGSIDTTNWKTDFDFDGFDWQGYQYAFKWGSSNRYETIAEFTAATGQESNGIQIDHTTCFDSLDFQVGGSGNVDSFYIQYNTLDPACSAVDAGIVVAGINEDFTGCAPDLGAYELGIPLPHYGVRPRCNGIEENRWTGAAIGNWLASPANWSLNRFPGRCDSVVIPAGITLVLNGNNKVGIHTLAIESSGDVRIEGQALLEVTEQ